MDGTTYCRLTWFLVGSLELFKSDSERCDSYQHKVITQKHCVKALDIQSEPAHLIFTPCNKSQSLC